MNKKHISNPRGRKTCSTLTQVQTHTCWHTVQKLWLFFRSPIL